jgi:hypothetical protein
MSVHVIVNNNAYKMIAAHEVKDYLFIRLSFSLFQSILCTRIRTALFSLDINIAIRNIMNKGNIESEMLILLFILVYRTPRD